MNGMIAVGWPLAAVLTLLTVAGAVTVRLGRIGTWRPVVTAAVRAVVQLGAVSLLITAVLASGWLTGGFVLMMFGIAAWTSGRRIFRLAGTAPAGRLGFRQVITIPAASIAGGVVPVLAVLLGSRLVPWEPVAIIPIAGILIGGAMTATSLAGRRALDELTARRGESEAALALGFVNRDAALLSTRDTAHQALVPVLDQTRTVGLVTLPGAFVGVLLGGGDPVQAGATQLVVLIALLAIEAVAVLVTVELLARRT
jgi:putative ABC transport system permease protein